MSVCILMCLYECNIYLCFSKSLLKNILLFSLNVFACMFPAQANDDVTVDMAQSFYVGGE